MKISEMAYYQCSAIHKNRRVAVGVAILVNRKNRRIACDSKNRRVAILRIACDSKNRIFAIIRIVIIARIATRAILRIARIPIRAILRFIRIARIAESQNVNRRIAKMWFSAILKNRKFSRQKLVILRIRDS